VSAGSPLCNRPFGQFETKKPFDAMVSAPERRSVDLARPTADRL
jgi:hypothetical protein